MTSDSSDSLKQPFFHEACRKESQGTEEMVSAIGISSVETVAPQSSRSSLEMRQGLQAARCFGYQVNCRRLESRREAQMGDNCPAQTQRKSN